jgi:hypothetical protein
MVLGWYAGRSLSDWLSLSLTGSLILSIFTSGLAAAVAVHLVQRLSIFEPGKALILRVSADGLTLGSPISLTLPWHEIDRVNVIRSSGGRLPVHHLQVIRTPAAPDGETRPEIMHHLGILWDRRSQDLADALNAHLSQSKMSTDGKERIYNSENWTGTR